VKRAKIVLIIVFSIVSVLIICLWDVVQKKCIPPSFGITALFVILGIIWFVSGVILLKGLLKRGVFRKF